MASPANLTSAVLLTTTTFLESDVVMEDDVVDHGGVSAAPDVDCPVNTPTGEALRDMFKFWLEGVILCAVGIFGILGNVLAAVVLTRNELRNSFNMLLVGLSLFDAGYLVCAIFEAVRKCFGVASQIQKLLYPHVLYPGIMITLTGSSFMIIAIAFERYVSVHHPLDYNQAMNDPREIRRRLLRYFVPVLVLSLSFNVPKFFEFQAELVPSNLTADATAWPFPGRAVVLTPTDMRVQHYYSSWVNWSQLVTLGVMPVCLLVYFNYKIYQDIRERERRRRPLAQRELAAAARATAPSAAPPANEMEMAQRNGRRGHHHHDHEDEDTPAVTISSRFHVAYKKTSQHLACLTVRRASSSSRSSSTPSRSSAYSASGVPASLRERDSAGMSNARRRRVEDRLAVLFMFIVAVYLVCQSPRTALNFYEMMVIERAMLCFEMGHDGFAAWAEILTSISHLLLVINSSINILIYVLFNTQFRKAARALFEESCCCLLAKLGCAPADGGGGAAAEGDGLAVDGGANGRHQQPADSSNSYGCETSGGEGGSVLPAAVVGCCNRRAKTRKRVRNKAGGAAAASNGNGNGAPSPGGGARSAAVICNSKRNSVADAEGKTPLLCNGSNKVALNGNHHDSSEDSRPHSSSPKTAAKEHHHLQGCCAHDQHLLLPLEHRKSSVVSAAASPSPSRPPTMSTSV